MTIFDSYESAQIYYLPINDRFFIFHHATFFMLPCLEREDGVKLICRSPDDVNAAIKDEAAKLVYIGEF